MHVTAHHLRGRAGFHYCTTLLHKVQMALKLETDPSEVLNELIYCCRKVPRPANQCCCTLCSIATSLA